MRTIGRRSIRLPGFDYSQPGFYFVTVCSHRRKPIFGRVVEGEVVLSVEGQIVEEEWLKTDKIRSGVGLDVYIIMPNYIHGIVILDVESNHQRVGAHRDAPLPYREVPLHRQPSSLGSFVAGFKGSVTRRVRHLLRDPGYSIWQRNYYEHVIRDEEELNRSRRYISENPLRWSQDRYYCS